MAEEKSIFERGYPPKSLIRRTIPFSIIKDITVGEELILGTSVGTMYINTTEGVYHAFMYTISDSAIKGTFFKPPQT